MRQFTKDEFLRLIGHLNSTDPTTPAYLTLLQSIECFDSIANTIDEIDRLRDVDLSQGEYQEGQIVHVVGVNPITKQETTPVVEETKSVPVTDKYEEEHRDPPPAPVEEKKEEKTYDASEVRKALVAARARGVDSKEVLAGFGVSHFQELPASKYGALMDALELL